MVIGDNVDCEEKKRRLHRIRKELWTRFLSGLSIEYCLGYHKLTRERSKSTPTILKQKES